jgi:RimJ/RimL family protein N-acetyltransferase/ribosomal protein S18 acetylase RimI-like enzyme
VFAPIRTERLLIRPFEPNDLASYHARRNDPDVARFQDWELPYPMERSEKAVTKQVAMDGPENDAWWALVVCDPDTGEVFGDVGAELSWKGRSAEVGYTFAKEHWGRGYAAEALEALVRYLFDDHDVTRVFGMLHPDNPASAMVLERTGFLFEGETKSSFWVGDEVSDDWIYGMTRPDWETWRDRPRHAPDSVRLVEVTAENAATVVGLTTHRSQEDFVAPMLRSFADAMFPEVVDGAPVVPWMRAVVADDVIVGFVMLALSTEHHPEPFLWRLLIDRLHQRRGIGSSVLELVEAECLAMGDESLLTSWGEGKGSPRPFDLAHGFVPTGRVVDEETEGRKRLSRAS